MSSERRVVITGCGVATPLGVGVDAFWEGLLARRSGIAPIQAFDASGFNSVLGGEVPDFKVTDYVPKSYRKSTKVMSRDISLAVVSAYEAVRDAGLSTKCLIDRGEAAGGPTVHPTRFGANIGAGLICADLNELSGALQTCGDHANGGFRLTEWGADGMTNLTPLWLLKFLPNMLGCHVTIVHDCQAPSNTITCGEASGHLAIGEAFRTIARGAAEVCICGGAESKVNPMGVMRQQLMSRLVRGQDDNPQSACRPFDPSVNGTVVGEGGGLLILEELEFARKRGARIYAEVIGFGAASNCTSWSDAEADGTGIALAIANALRDAGASPEQVDLFGSFGTGCSDFDASELAAVSRVFGKRRAIPALAIKGAVGSSGAGAGAMDIVAATLAVHHNTIPPSAGTLQAQTDGILKFAQDDPLDARIGIAVSVAYSLSGGQTAALVIRKLPA
jgi:3-oxoacyl-[acyl-carrier-protein] synthase II